MPARTVLLLASHPSLADHVSTLIRRAGLEVVPGWYNDSRAQPMGAAPVDLVLVERQHHASRSPAFRRMAEQLGVLLAYFSATPQAEPFDAVIDAGDPVPVLVVDEGGEDFIAALRRLLPANRA